MRWQTVVKPPNRKQYLNRCESLRRCLKDADVMPPFLVAANCLFVLRKAFGGNWAVLRWMVLNMAHDQLERFKETAWLNYQLYVRLRSWDEIDEIQAKEIEEITGEDVREWPDILIDEERTEV